MASFIATNTNTANSDGFVFPAAGDDLAVPLDIHILATGAGFAGVTGPGGAIVQNNGRILGNAAGISLGGTGQTTTILNYADGTISSTTGAAILVAATGAGSNVNIQNGGTVSATVGTDGAIQVDGAGQIVNFGLVTSAGIGVVQVGSVASTSLFSLVNTATGVIVGGTTGYGGQNSLIVEQIDNSGLINGGVVLGDGNGASMVNQATGRLTGAAPLSSSTGSGGDVTFGDGDNDRFTNLGTMGVLAMGNGAQAYVVNYGTMGGITLGNGAGAYVGNAGTIVGDVQLGNGAGQVFDSTLGMITGTVTAGSGGATIVGALNGGHLVGGAGNDVLIANQTNLVGYAVVTTLDGKGGSNALYGGQGTNLFLSGNATYNQIWGAESAISGTHYSNNTVDYAAVTGAGRGIYVDLHHGHNAYIIDNGSYTFVDAIEHVPNVKGTAGADIIQASGNPGIIEGRGGADQLYSGSGADTFVYTGYADSNLVSGYDTISGFQTGVDKIDLSAFGLSAANALIESNATSTVLYLEMNPGSFNPATDLAISFTGANALALSDITFVSSAPNGWSFFDYNNFYGTGYPDQSLMPTGTEAFVGNINIGLVLDRAHDPTELLEANWGTRQKMLAALGDHPLSYYGAKPEDYHDVVDALQSMGITLSTNPAYESSAESRTVWVSLTAQQFQTLFGQQLLYQEGNNGADGSQAQVYWTGNLALNAGVASLGTVKGLAFDTDYGNVNIASITLPNGVLPDGSTAQGVPLIQGPQGPGNDTNNAPVSVAPQDVAKLYNFPLVNHPDAPTGRLGLIEPGMGSDTFTSTNIETLLDNYREAIGLTQQTGVIVIGQQQGGTQDTDSKERSLDLGVATAVNPNSTLVLYAGSGTADGAGSSAYSAYQSAFLDAGHASVVSSSFRFGSMQPGADSPFLWAARELMIDAALQNITVFQSSGDGGSSYATGNGLTNTANARASEYSVIVGGTSLSTGGIASGRSDAERQQYGLYELRGPGAGRQPGRAVAARCRWAREDAGRRYRQRLVPRGCLESLQPQRRYARPELYRQRLRQRRRRLHPAHAVVPERPVAVRTAGHERCGACPGARRARRVGAGERQHGLSGPPAGSLDAVARRRRHQRRDAALGVARAADQHHLQGPASAGSRLHDGPALHRRRRRAGVVQRRHDRQQHLVLRVGRRHLRPHADRRRLLGGAGLRSRLRHRFAQRRAAGARAHRHRTHPDER